MENVELASVWEAQEHGLRLAQLIKKKKLTANGAADLSPPRPDAGTVPDHAVLGSLVGFPHSVGLLVDLIKAPFLCCREKTTQEGLYCMDVFLWCVLHGGLMDAMSSYHRVCFCT